MKAIINSSFKMQSYNFFNLNRNFICYFLNHRAINATFRHIIISFPNYFLRAILFIIILVNFAFVWETVLLHRFLLITEYISNFI